MDDESIIGDLTETYESVMRADYDIFKPLVEGIVLDTEEQIDHLVAYETELYAAWLRKGIAAAKADED